MKNGELHRCNQIGIEALTEMSKIVILQNYHILSKSKDLNIEVILMNQFLIIQME